MTDPLKVLIWIACFLVIPPYQSAGAAVSAAAKSCITRAMADGSRAALSNDMRLRTKLFEQYFDVHELAARAAGGKRWQGYSPSEQAKQVGRVRAFVTGPLASGLSAYAGSSISFVWEKTDSRGLRSVRGTVIAKNGSRGSVAWYFAKVGCQFLDITVEGFGSLSGLIGREVTPAR